jgi:hypothetical protein
MTITCVTCRVETPKTGPVQKYCPPCSEQADLRRKSKWAKAHPAGYDPTKRRLTLEKRKAISAEVFSIIRTTDWFDVPHPEMAWEVRMKVPFSYGFSKNAIWSTTRRGHVYMRKEAQSLREALILLVKSHTVGQPIVQSKVWIDILVQKPDQRGDAINVIDTVADAIKVAIDVDDRWFSLRRVDWEINKSDPHMFIAIGQESTEPVKACSHCGRLLPLSNFGKRAHSKDGHSRACLDCSRILDRYRRETRG